MSKKISKLFITRGVPGTHNLKSLKEILKIFKSNKKKKYNLPYFSKGHDDILYSKSINLTFPYDIFILEDSAESHFAKYRNKAIGSLGNASVFSFYGNKTITTGEGGMINTNSKKIKFSIYKTYYQGCYNC